MYSPSECSDFLANSEPEAIIVEKIARTLQNIELEESMDGDATV
jgi:hypothetical protein